MTCQMKYDKLRGTWQMKAQTNEDGGEAERDDVVRRVRGHESVLRQP